MLCFYPQWFDEIVMSIPSWIHLSNHIQNLTHFKESWVSAINYTYSLLQYSFIFKESLTLSYTFALYSLFHLFHDMYFDFQNVFWRYRWTFVLFCCLFMKFVHLLYICYDELMIIRPPGQDFEIVMVFFSSVVLTTTINWLLYSLFLRLILL